MGFRTDAAGDIVGADIGGSRAVDPVAWGWAGTEHRVPPERRRTVDQLAGLPGFEVQVGVGPKVTPGPRRRGTRWMSWQDGEGPPACYESRRGASGYFDRLSEALGYVANRLPANPDGSPYVVHDLVGGRRIDVAYRSPPVGPGGEGVVYVIDDGQALKVGHTTGAPAIRVNALQSGNPRDIRTLATIAAASPEVEAHLHRALAGWHVRGEWFRREPVLAAVAEAPGWRRYLRKLLGDGWEISVHPDPEGARRPWSPAPVAR